MKPVTDPGLIAELEQGAPPRLRPVTDPTILEELNRPLSAAETAADVGTRTMGGVNRAVANVAMLPFRASAWLTGTQGRGFEGAGEQALGPWLNQPEPETRAGRFGQSVGEAVGYTALPSATILRAASRLPQVARSAAPGVAETFLRPIAQAPGAATAIDIAASTGSGLAQEGAREAGASPGVQSLASFAGGLAPLPAAAGAARIMSATGRGLQNRLGIRASADGSDGPFQATPANEAAAYRILADNLLQAGVKPDDLHTALSKANAARIFHSQGAAQDVTALMDVDESLMRLAGSLARQNPEAARIISHFIQARQTGRTPLGTTPEAMAQRGLPVRQTMAPAITGAQAQESLGSAFGAAQKGTVAMGQRERISDMIRRSLLIRDAKSHGHLPSAYQTRIRINDEGKKASDKAYGTFRSLSQGYDPGKDIQSLVTKTRAIIDNPATDKTTAELLERALGTLYRDGRLVSSMDGLDGAQRALRAMYESADSNTRRLLGGFRRELVDAADLIKDRGIGKAYQDARRSHFDTRRMDEAYDLGVKGPDEVEDFLGRYNALRSEAERKVTRLGLSKHYDDKMSKLQPTDNATKIFKQRDFDLLAGVIPRSQKGGAEFSDRPQRVGRYLAAERRSVEARDVSRGGSSSLRNVADDQALETLQQLAIKDTLDTVSSFVGVFRGSESLWQVGQRVFTLAIDKAFGMRAESSVALAHMLTTANPEKRVQIITRLSQIMELERMQRFNDILSQYQKQVQAATASGAATLGSVAGPVEQAPPRP